MKDFDGKIKGALSGEPFPLVRKETNTVTPAEFEKDLVSLRTEIVECLKARIDLLKYKLLIIAILGSIGLGLTDKINVEKAVVAPVYVLCVIPFACIFVDSLCMHNNLRILVIAKF